MKVRRLLGLTAVASSILGAVIVYLVLTVPNDLKADTLLKEARQHLAAGKTPAAREALSRVVQEHPRTDAASAATLALVRLADQERARLDTELKRLRAENDQQTKALRDLRTTVDAIKNAPPPKPQIIVQAPPKPAPKRTTPQRRTPTRRRRG